MTGADPFRHMKMALVLVLFVILVGTFGYQVIEEVSPLDGLYMTIITLTTVGYGYITGDASTAGKVFTICLLAVGVSIAAWAARTVFEFALSEAARDTVRRRKMRSAVEKISNHFIVCGYGRMGREVSSEFRKKQVQHVVVESQPEQVYELVESDIPHIVGDAADEEVLRDAGIGRARGLIAVAGTDAQNTFIALTARGMRPDIFIVARASVPESEKKLLSAGADRAISPYVIGGRRIAASATQPTVDEFLDVVMHGDNVELAMDELEIEEESALAGRTLAKSEIRERSGAVIIAIKDAQGELQTNPARDAVLCPHDILIAVGTVAQLKRLAEMCGS